MPYNSLINRSDALALIPEDVSREIIAGASQKSAVFNMGRRAPNLPARVRRMPVLDVLPTAYFVSGDTGLKQTTEVSWSNKYFYAEELAVIVPIPENVLDDSEYDIWAAIKPSLDEAFGRAIDGAVLYSTNKPTDWPDGLVPGAIAASQTVDYSTQLAASDDLYDMILGENGVYAKVEEDGFAVTGALAALSMKAKLRGTRDSNGQPIFNRTPQSRFGYELDGVGLDFPLNGGFDAATSLLIAGDFQQLMYAFRADISYKLLTEGVIQDNTGAIIYNLAQQDMVALRAVMRVAWQIPNPINAVNTNSATRYPFAVLVP